MSWKKNAVIVVGVFTVATGALTALAPQTPDEYRQNQQEQHVSDLVDAQEQVEENRREQGLHDGEALQAEKDVPGEHRPPERHTPKIRIRIP